MSAGSVFYNMSRAELHGVVKEELSSRIGFVFYLLKETRYCLDPESERQIRECIGKMELIAASSRLIDRSEAKPASGNVIHLATRSAWRAEPCPA